NRELWSKVKQLNERILHLEKEKEQLEKTIEQHKRSLNTLVEKIQRFLSLTTDQGMIQDEEENKR
ncbi:MAG: hypothetical protein JG779_1463, partial [Thermotoga sp.]|nr:hypothetical protein [Thermotoga sp.]